MFLFTVNQLGDQLQEQFPDLHEFSEVQPHMNIFIISSGTKQTSGATGKGIRYLVSPSFHSGQCQLLEDQHLTNISMQLSASESVSSSEKMNCQLVVDFLVQKHPIYSLQNYTSTSFSMDHVEFLLYFGRNNAEETLFLVSDNSQEVHAGIQLNLNRYSFYSAHL